MGGGAGVGLAGVGLAGVGLVGVGSMDRQALSGKTPAGILAVAARASVPVIAFAGRVDAAEGLLAAGFAVVVPDRGPVDLATALREGPANLEAAVAATLTQARCPHPQARCPHNRLCPASIGGGAASPIPKGLKPKQNTCEQV